VAKKRDLGGRENTGIGRKDEDRPFKNHGEPGHNRGAKKGGVKIN